MGSIKNTSCPWIFQRSVVVVTSMASFREESCFLHYRASCQLVDVNITKEDQMACPECIQMTLDFLASEIMFD